MSAAKKYEAGMRVTFNEAAKTVTVNFRGRVAILPGPYTAGDEGIRAGEDYCRKQGWANRPQDERAGQSMIKRNP